MSNKKTTSSSGISFMGLLAIVFITLKLCNVITWSWWWVTAPLWGGLAFWAAIALFAIVIAGFAALLSCIVGRKS